jgi:DNA repair exonuclease SbcCD nuclease subunit
MKIGIISDLHIGYERFSQDAYLQAKEALERAASMADALIIPGDVFDKRAPKPETMAEAINIFRALSRRQWDAKVVSFTSKPGADNSAYTDVPIVAISGTHERTAEGKENALRLLSLAGLLVDTSEATTVLQMGDEKVAVFGLGGVSEERVKEKLDELAPKPVAGAFNIFMFHQSTYELLPFSSEFIHYDDLPTGFDLYVNGHIHSRVEAYVHSKRLLIPGSTVLTQLKEGEQESKGFIVFDTKTGDYSFERINSRPFVARHIKIDEATPKSLMSACEVGIEGIISVCEAKPIIKLYLEGTIKGGFSASDMPFRSLSIKYSATAFLDIDSSGLRNTEVDRNIQELREGKIGELSIRELGMSMLGAKLRDAKFDPNIDFQELFNILAEPTSKEKLLIEALEYISKKTVQ